MKKSPRGKPNISPIVPEQEAPVVQRFTPVAAGLAGMYLLLYGITALIPTQGLWGIDQLRYLDPALRIALLGFSLAIALPFFANRYVPFLEAGMRRLFRSRGAAVVVSIILGIASAMAFYYCRIATDMYGDSRSLLEILAVKEYTVSDLLSFRDFEPLTRMVHQAAARFFQIDQKAAYEYISAGCGGAFVVLTLLFVGKNDESPRWKLLATLMLLTAGANALFFGHVEDYTLIYLCLTGFLVAGWFLFRGNKTLPIMIALFLVGVKLHIAMVLLLPALVYAILHTMRDTSPHAAAMLRPRNILFGVLATFLLAACAYVFLFKAYTLSLADPQERIEKIFLPLFNPLAAPHSYSLFSWKHLLDVGNELLFTVSPAAVLLIVLGAAFPRLIRWDAPEVIFFGLGALYSCLFTVTVNPILTMARDWDLFSLVSAPLTFAALALARHVFRAVRQEAAQRALIGCCLAPALLAATIFYVDAQPQSAPRRLVNIGAWAYNSYYIGSSYLINVGQKSIADIDEQIRQRKALIDTLRPHASANDVEMGFLYRKLAETCFYNKQFNDAVRYLTVAASNDTSDREVIKLLAISQFLAENFDDADRSIGEYNRRVNEPEVKDFSALGIAQYINFFQQQQFNHADPKLIRRQLDEIFYSYRPK